MIFHGRHGLGALLLALGLVSGIAARSEAQGYDWSGCRGMLVYPHNIDRRTRAGDILIEFSTKDSKEQVRDFYAQALRGWRFEDGSTVLPAQWRFAYPASRQKVIIYWTWPGTRVQFQC